MTTDAEIIEAMARELSANNEKYRHIPWVYLAPRVQEMLRSDARAAFAICAPAIRAQAMEEAAKVADAFADKWATNARNARADSHSEAVCESAADAGRELASAIRALAPPAVAEKGESGQCLCRRCSSERRDWSRMANGADVAFRFACEICGNKRCPHHEDHRFVCTGSNEPGQVGVPAPAAPAESKGESE